MKDAPWLCSAINQLDIGDKGKYLFNSISKPIIFFLEVSAYGKNTKLSNKLMKES